MVATVTAKYSVADGSTAVATKTSTSQSYAAGSRVLVVGHALRNGHSAGLGANWAVTSSATTNSLTWTELAFSPANTWSSTFELQSAALVSSELTATESFTVTVDASTSTGDTFYYVLQAFEVVGSNGTLVQAGAGTATTTTSGSPTLGSAPSRGQLIIGTALCSGDSIAWSAAPANFTAVSGAAATPVGGMSASACYSSTNTGTSVTWSWTNTESTLATNMLLIELADSGLLSATAGVAAVGMAAGNATTTAAYPSISQTHYRWGLDDGSESGHTFAAAEDAGVTVATGQRRLLRVQLAETGGVDLAAGYSLQYRRVGDPDWRTIE